MLRTLKHTLRQIYWWGAGYSRYCPICCRRARRFQPYGVTCRPDVGCPFCGSAERHRLMWLYIEKHTDLLHSSGKSVIHFTPEWAIRNRLKTVAGIHYVTADLFAPDVTFQLDITRNNLADNSFDVLLSSMLLQHIFDDRTAMREMFRILRPGGWALLFEYIRGENTVEFAPEENGPVRNGNNADEAHRRYGMDLQERLSKVGFEVEVISPNQIASPKELSRMRIPADLSPLLFCRKPIPH